MYNIVICNSSDHVLQFVITLNTILHERLLVIITFIPICMWCVAAGMVIDMNNNRFSMLLEELMEIADVKNITMAQELQYDVSYISKWINGRTLPSERGLEKILHGISRCITDSVNDEKRELLYRKYSVFCMEDLEQVIYDNLMIEYNYVKNLKVDTGSEIAPQIVYYPEQTLLQFVTKMRHPVLRKVESLEVVAMLDLLAMDKNCQTVVAELQDNYNNSIDRKYPGVHFSMLIDTSRDNGNTLRNTELILNMISNFSNVDFNLYESKQAIGKLIFTVKEGFTISGMMTDSNHCIAVTAIENPEISSVMYDKLKSFCGHSNQILEHASVSEFLGRNNYMKSILSEQQYWLISSLTEHFLSEDLFEELLTEQMQNQLDEATVALIRKNHALTRNIMREISTKILLYESALQNFMVSGEMDLFCCKVHLTTRQRLRCLENLIEQLKRNTKIEVRVFSTEYLHNFHLLKTPNVFCSYTISYIRLKNQAGVKILNKISVSHMFVKSLGDIWERLDVKTSEDGWSVEDTWSLINHISRALHLLTKTEDGAES